MLSIWDAQSRSEGRHQVFLISDRPTSHSGNYRDCLSDANNGHDGSSRDVSRNGDSR